MMFLGDFYFSLAASQDALSLVEARAHAEYILCHFYTFCFTPRLLYILFPWQPLKMRYLSSSARTPNTLNKCRKAGPPGAFCRRFYRYGKR